MNWQKLQLMQSALDNAILSEKAEMTAEERFNKTLNALSVEVAEVANCAEYFKFWKENKGKVDEKRFYCIPQTFHEGSVKPSKYVEEENQAKVLTFEKAHKLTLIEECSDCLHFILSLANQLDIEIDKSNLLPMYEKEIIYLCLQRTIAELEDDDDCHAEIFYRLITMFFMYINDLGVTEQELEQAYYEKNKINYERLENGY